ACVAVGNQNLARLHVRPFEHRPALYSRVRGQPHVRYLGGRLERGARAIYVCACALRGGEQAASPLPENRIRPSSFLIVVLGGLPIVRRVGVALRVAIEGKGARGRRRAAQDRVDYRSASDRRR